MYLTKKLILLFTLPAILIGTPATTWADRERNHHDHDTTRWRSGHWHHSVHDGRLGWWWVAGGFWYPFVRSLYPYPDPYVPQVVVVRQQPVLSRQPPPPPQTVVPAQTQTQYWYFCEQSNGYYPYVQDCPAGWMAVPAAPPSMGPGASP